MEYTLELLKQMADTLALQFGPDCEVVIHDLTENLEQSIVYIKNGHVSNRKVGDGPSKAALKVLEQSKIDPDKVRDHLEYLTKTASGKILKSSSMYIRDKEGNVRYLLAVNYNISSLLMIEESIKNFLKVEENAKAKEEPIVHNVNDLLDSLIQQSVELIGKPAALMTKEDKMEAIHFLNEKGAFLITRSGDKVSRFFGISKYTLYNYIDLKKKYNEK